MSPCAHIHTRVCMQVCVRISGSSVCVCMEASNDIDMENVVYGTVRYVTTVMYLSAYLRDYNLLPYI